ncbi:hypothetical protein VE04_10085 [Pseudogymnoascus sp. 24MN13]|nr:hypothetical protein VE04_10085 [Pseudogymnoascus sp. 24MN13]
MSGLLLYVMFPQYNFICDLDRGSSNGAGAGASTKDKVITLMRREDEVMLIDEIILLAIYKAVQSANILQHYPTSAALIKANALVGGKEKYVKVSYSREQFLLYMIKLEHLNAIWQGEQVYVNVGKQVTSPSAELLGQQDRTRLAETFLYR